MPARSARPRRRRKRQLANAALKNGLLVVGAVLFFEVFLQVASIWVVAIDLKTYPKRPSHVTDAELGVRGDPAYPEHDERGFRNRRALRRAEVVALGDSHTYGGGVEPEEAWPSLLAAHLKRSVYNMGFGAYGATHNAHNLSVALDLKPKLVLFGLYFGNDFYDDFYFVQRRGGLRSFASAEVLREIEALESKATIAEEVGLLNRRGRAKWRSDNAIVVWLHAGLQWFKGTSRAYGLVRNLYYATSASPSPALLSRRFEKAAAAITPEQRAFASPFAGKEWKTILTVSYRYRVLDDSDPRIRTGLEISKSALQEMQRRLSLAKVDFLVVLLPTKESVFRPRLDNVDRHRDLVTLAGTEDRLRDELKGFMTELGIAYVDAVPGLRKSVQQPYFADTDGHPNTLGHRIIAEAIIGYLESDASSRIGLVRE